MAVTTKLATLAMGGFMLVAAYTPALAGSGSSVDQSVASTSPSVATGSVLSALGFNDVVAHPVKKTCKAETLYSQHDVIGDPDACFVGKFDVRSGSSVVGAPTL